ncbi:MAG: tetratricopeptide repeat protein [Nitrospirae bacterium]|nr:MAG: tetratricopeptide repeat protein [Nitrospirota bacterium]
MLNFRMLERRTILRSMLPALLIIGIGLIIYSNTFYSPFYFDDEYYIVKNPVIKDLSYFWGPSKAKDFENIFGYHTLVMRYIGDLTFALNYELHGLDVSGYHAANIAIHLINALLAYLLTSLVLKTPRTGNSSEYERLLLPLAAALIFVSHPVQTESVTYITQRFTSLAAMFYLLSFIGYAKFRLTEKKIWYAAAITSAILGMKTKEIVFTLPPMLTLFEFMFFEGDAKKRIKHLLPILLTLIIIPASLFVISKHADIAAILNDATRAKSDMPRSDYLFTQFRVVITYLRLLMLPVNQNLDYNYPVYTSFLNPDVFLSFIAIAALIGTASILPLKTNDRHLRIASFGLLWFFAALSVESSMIPTQDMIFEHRTYLPSFGFIVSAVSLLFFMKDKFCLRNSYVAAFLAIVTIVLCILTYQRNDIWADELTLWEDTAKKTTDKARVYNNLGFACNKKGQPDRAIVLYRTALSLKPDYAEAYNNLGYSYYTKKMFSEAIEQYEKAISLMPSFAEAYNNLGAVYGDKNKTDIALEYFKTAARLNPGFISARYNAALAYFRMGMRQEAMKETSELLKIMPGNKQAQELYAKIVSSSP